MTDLRFDDRVAVITGAGSDPGLGRAYALLLASRGARVLVNDVADDVERGQSAELVAQEIRAAGGLAISNHDSVATRQGSQAIIDAAIEEWGRVDILINNAGVAPAGLFKDISDETASLIVTTHLMGHIWLAKAAWPHMLSQQYGRIVNTSSGLGFMGFLYHPIYAAAKLGIVGLTRALAAEGSRDGIVVNAVVPSAATLGRFQAAIEISAFEGRELSAMTEPGDTPESVAPVVALMAHESCDWMGKSLTAEGGACSELLISLTKGAERDPELTPERLRARLDQVLDRDDAIIVDASVPW